MPGKHRKAINTPGQAHELTFCCYRRYPFLSKDRTQRWLAESINRAAQRLDYEVWAWVFMPEHVHLLVNPKRPTYAISDFLAQIKQPVSRKAVAYLKETESLWLDRITTTRGKRVERLFWQRGGGYDRNLTDPETVHAAIQYIHANPVRRGLVQSPTDWPWSSAAFYEHSTPTPIHTTKPNL